jgi:hypothetical protein
MGNIFLSFRVSWCYHATTLIYWSLSMGRITASLTSVWLQYIATLFLQEPKLIAPDYSDSAITRQNCILIGQNRSRGEPYRRSRGSILWRSVVMMNGWKRSDSGFQVGADIGGGYPNSEKKWIGRWPSDHNGNKWQRKDTNNIYSDHRLKPR